MKNITVLGSTGSIGVQALDVARLHGWGITALTAYSHVDIIEKQIREFKPKLAALVDEKAAAELKLRVADTDTKILAGKDGVCECAAVQTDTLLNSIVGMAGLEPTLTAIKNGTEIALANKETLVAGGKLVTDTAKENNVRILPVDSEHSAIFQSLQGNNFNRIKRILLTASGGPFFGKTKDELKNVTVKEALNHPNWSMGAKITIDSATMVNKGLELIEAVWLFSVLPSQIDILVHRQSVVHSLVEYEDNSVMAQLGVPDMRVPIQYALTYPKRYNSPAKQLRLEDYKTLTFEQPDYDVFKAINICRNAVEKGGLCPAIVNSANEKANELFRQGKIKFLDIAELIEEAVKNTKSKDTYTLSDVLETDRQVKEYINSLV